jgi:hypothetical protein
LTVLVRCVEICLGAMALCSSWYIINTYNCPAGDLTERVSNMLQQTASAISALQANGPVDKEIEISIEKYHILRANLVLLAIHDFLNSNVLKVSRL